MLLCPASMCTAFAHCEPGAPLPVDGQSVEYWTVGAHATLFNYSGYSAVVVPYGLDADDMPIGASWWANAGTRRSYWRRHARWWSDSVTSGAPATPKKQYIGLRSSTTWATLYRVGRPGPQAIHPTAAMNGFCRGHPSDPSSTRLRVVAADVDHRQMIRERSQQHHPLVNTGARARSMWRCRRPWGGIDRGHRCISCIEERPDHGGSYGSPDRAWPRAAYGARTPRAAGPIGIRCRVLPVPSGRDWTFNAPGRVPASGWIPRTSRRMMMATSLRRMLPPRCTPHRRLIAYVPDRVAASDTVHHPDSRPSHRC